MKKAVFLGGKPVGEACLEFMLQNMSQLSCQLMAIVPNNKNALSSTSRLEELAGQFDIPLLDGLSDLKEDPDFIVSVQYNKILDKSEIARAKTLAINLHMAPLPEYRGCNQFSFAIVDKVEEFGTSIHRLEPSIDGGDLLFERRFSIEPGIFVKELYDRTERESIDLFKEAWPRIIEGDFEQIPQSKLADRKEGFYLRKDIEKLKNIDVNWPEEKQRRYFRACFFPPYDPPVLVDGSEILQELDMSWYSNQGR